MLGLSVNEAGDIYGTSSGTTLPVGVVEITQAQLEDYHLASKTIALSGREVMPKWNGSAVVIPEDTRPIFRVEVNRSAAQDGLIYMLADGVDVITLTITKIDSLGVTDTTLNTNLVFQVADRFFNCVFVNGVAVKPYTTTKSGITTIRGAPKFAVETPVTIVAAE